MDDLISRQAAIEVLKAIKYGLWEIDISSPTVPEYIEHHEQIRNMMEITDGWIKRLAELPSAQPEYKMDEWCTDCKEYDHEKHCCPRFNRVILTTLSEAQERKKGKWIPVDEDEWIEYKCSVCGHNLYSTTEGYNFCPNCGAEMRGDSDG